MKLDMDTVRAWADYHPDANVQAMAIDYLKALSFLNQSGDYLPGKLYCEIKEFLVS